MHPNHTVLVSFSAISVSFALCVAFGAKIKSVNEPDGVENLSFRFVASFPLHVVT